MRGRFLVLVLALTLAAVLATPTGPPVDGVLFVGAGQLLVHGHLSQVFASPLVQTGPLTLLGFGLVGTTGLALQVVLCLIACSATVLAGKMLHRSDAWILLVGAAGIVAGLLTAVDAHPTQLVVPVLWLAALRSRSSVLTGVLLGVGCGLDSWAVLGVGVLVVAERPLRALLVAAAVTLLAWGPFVLAGGIRTGEYSWFPVPHSLPALLFGLHPVPWSYRAVQGAAVLLLGAGVAWWRRADPELPWLLPALLVGARIALDPLDRGYYGVGWYVLLAFGAARGQVRAGAALTWSGSAGLLSAGPLVAFAPGVLLLWLAPASRSTRVSRVTSRVAELPPMGRSGLHGAG